MTPGPHVGPAHILASTFPPERRPDPLDELIPVGGDSEKIWRFDTLWEAENFVLNKTKGGELLVRVYCETGDTRTAKIESFFSGLFSCGAPKPRLCQRQALGAQSSHKLRSSVGVPGVVCSSSVRYRNR